MKAVFVKSSEWNYVQDIPRALKATQGFWSSIYILCWDRADFGLPRHETVDGMTIIRFKRCAPPRSAMVLIYWFWFQVWVFWQLLLIRPKFVEVYEMMSAVPVAAYRTLTLFTTRMAFHVLDPFAPALGLRGLTRWTCDKIEHLMVGFSNGVIVPSQDRIPYLGWWGRHRPVHILPNTCDDLMERLPAQSPISSLPRGVIRLVYAGYLDRTRGADWLANWFNTNDVGAELVVVGKSRDAALNELFANSKRVRILGQLPYEDAMAVMRDCEALLLMYDPNFEINRLCAPNKQFDAMMLGRPIICSEGMCLCDLTRNENLGFVVRYCNGDDLLACIQTLTDPAKRDGYRTTCRIHFLKHYQLRDFLGDYGSFLAKIVGRPTATAEAPGRTELSGDSHSKHG